jgi:hypothetical protein
VCSYNLMGDDTTPGTLLPLSFAACFLLSFLFYCLFFRCFNPATQTAQVRATAWTLKKFVTDHAYLTKSEACLLPPTLTPLRPLPPPPLPQAPTNPVRRQSQQVRNMGRSTHLQLLMNPPSAPEPPKRTYHTPPPPFLHNRLVPSSSSFLLLCPAALSAHSTHLYDHLYAVTAPLAPMEETKTANMPPPVHYAHAIRVHD